MWHMAKRAWVAGAVVAAAACGSAPTAAPRPAVQTDAGRGQARAAGAPDYAAWGSETLEHIEKHFRVRGTGLYREAVDATGAPAGRYGPYSFIWPAGFQLRALTAAARAEPRRYKGRLAEFTGELDAYLARTPGRTAYMVLTTDSELFYDDNAWMLIGLAETHELTRQPGHLQRAKAVLEFLASGQGEFGEIPQKETERGTGYGFTCTVAPAAVGALMLYERTGDRRYLDLAKRWYAWLTDRKVGVQDPASGLYHQGAAWDGKAWQVKRGYRAYQTALPMQAAVRLHRLTKEPAYLDEAQRLAASCISKWIDAKTGALCETAQWGGSDLCDALLDLVEVDGDPRWPQAVRSALMFLHDNARSAQGFYPEEWNRDSSAALEKRHLMHQSAAARAFWRAAIYQRHVLASPTSRP